MRVESAVMPEYKEYLRGQIFVNFNVETEATENGTKYIYEQLRFNPPMSDEALDKEVARCKEALKPKVITMRQARLALLDKGLLTAVDEAIATGTDEVLKVEWEYATEVRRDWVNLIAMATSLGMTEEQLDNLFIKGSKL